MYEKMGTGCGCGRVNADRATLFAKAVANQKSKSKSFLDNEVVIQEIMKRCSQQTNQSENISPRRTVEDPKPFA
jgi:hypothetical protein